MIRFLILGGYFELMMYLQVSGKLDQYINVHYRYLAILSMILSGFLAVIQLIIWTRSGKEEHNDHHGHHHDLEKPYQKVIAYLLLALPLIVGLLFPTVSLDTTIVDAKGFQFPLSKESVGDPEMQTQYLKPDTSIYFNRSDYQDQMDEAMSHYQSDTIQITDSNYLEVMELIYNYPSEFLGKQISYDGFVYNDPVEDSADVFVFRFGIIHCVADSGVFGLLNELPKGHEYADNDWVHVTGMISQQYYQPFKRELPIIKVTDVTPIGAPENQYVYRSF